MVATERIALYPGTFDPVTLGHLDIIRRSSSLFDKVIVGILDDDGHGTKKAFFAADVRKTMLLDSLQELSFPKNIDVETYSGLLVEFAKKKKVAAVVRGLRAVSDFDYEFQLEVANKHLYPSLETIFFMTDQKYFYLSSSMVKEIASHKGDISTFVTKAVAKSLAGRQLT